MTKELKASPVTLTNLVEILKEFNKKFKLTYEDYYIIGDAALIAAGVINSSNWIGIYYIGDESKLEKIKKSKNTKIFTDLRIPLSSQSNTDTTNEIYEIDDFKITLFRRYHNIYTSFKQTLVSNETNETFNLKYVDPSEVLEEKVDYLRLLWNYERPEEIDNVQLLEFKFSRAIRVIKAILEYLEREKTGV